MNVIPCVFNRASEEHENFKPVLEWIVNGKGKMVCGGTEYWEEFRKIGKYLKFFNQLNKAGKVVKVDDDLVDQKMNELKELCNDSDFDDPHIAALLIVSGCNVLCSEDERSYPYIKRKEWYPNGRKPPKIYKSSTFKYAAKILSDSNMAEICMPCLKLKKEQSDLLMAS
ncbi:MAG: hypothetical protein MI867_04590, partial [Pseudomonadales bacterium]|nr:hypothetical protein [Pseudomonadales bacterium]